MNRFSEQPLEQDFQTKMNTSENKDGEKKKQNQGNQFQRAQSNHGHGRGGNKYTQYNARGKSKSESCCKICKKTNHETMDCYFKKCTRCKNSNHHLQKDCQFRKRDEAKFPVKGESSNQLFQPGMNTQQEAQDTWYNDSRCSNHMTGNKSNFVNLDEGVKSNEKLGDEKFQNIKGKGTIAVQTKGAMEPSTSSGPTNSCIPLSIPSEAEAESTISEFRSYLQSEVGSEVGSFPLISSLDSPRNMQSVKGMTIHKAFELMDVVKPIQKLVKQAISNEGVWTAFLEIDEVKKLCQQLETGAYKALAFSRSNPSPQKNINFCTHQQFSGANKVVAISSSNLQRHVNVCNKEPSSGANKAAAMPNNNSQTYSSFRSQQQSSAQPDGLKPNTWEKIFTEFIRIGKTIFIAFKILFGKDFCGDEFKGKGKEKYQSASEDPLNSSEVELTKEYIEVAFALANVLMLGILLMRYFVIRY